MDGDRPGADDAAASVRHAEAFDALVTELEGRFEGFDGSAWSDADFQRYAFEAFTIQFGGCEPYRALCERRGVTPETVESWVDVPAVPANGFKHFDLLSNGDPAEVDAVFRTSGTTRGEAARGRHLIPRLSLYQASLVGPFRRALLPDRDRIRLASLIPSPAELPDSSLSYMIGAAGERFSTETHWLLNARGEWTDCGESTEWASGDEPILLVGTALSFVHAIERLPRLPEGSRIMETGGFKGAKHTVSRDELYRSISAATDVPPDRIVNEYGMTELLSQLYEPVLGEGAASAGVHVPPPWLRIRALDPMSLEPVEEGEDGLLAFFDLANLGSVSHVLTEDIGSVADGRVRLRGRVLGAEPRGCSRAMDELMRAAAGDE